MPKAVCSDGLSYYYGEAGDLAGLALPAGLTTPLDAATALVKAAYDAGGGDAVLVPFPPSTNNLARVSQDLGQPD